MATQRKCWELLTTEVILVDQKWHRAIITGQSKAERALQAWFCAILSRRKKRRKRIKGRKKEVLVTISWTGSTEQIKGGCL